MSKEQVTQHEERLRAEFKELMVSGKSEVKKLIAEAEDYLADISVPEGYEESALIALKEVQENRKLYFQHYSIIKQFVEFQRKLNKKDTDDDFIIFQMTREEIISGLEALMKESKVANAKIEFSYEVDRIKKRLTKLEEEIENIKRRTDKEA